MANHAVNQIRRGRLRGQLRLTVRHNGIDRRLTDVHGRVWHPIIA